MFPCVLHLALSLFPGCIWSVYILRIWCRLLLTCIGFFHVFFICQICPSKLHLFFPFFLHLQFLPLFNLHFVFPFFLHLSCVPLSELHFPVPFFFIVSPFFSRCKHPRTSAIRQHNRIHEDGQDTGDDVLRWWTWDSCCDPGCAELLHKGSWYILDSDHLDDSILPFASRC